MNSKVLAESLLRLADELGTEKAVDSFLVFLEKNHLTGLLPKILDHLEIANLREVKNDTVFLKTSHDFSKSVVESILKKNQIKSQKIDKRIDEGLIAGFEMKYAGILYEGNLKNYLKNLKTELAK